jgi:hypothetical protein
LYEYDNTFKEYFLLKNNGHNPNKLIYSKAFLTNETNVNMAEQININEWIDKINILIWKRVDKFEYSIDQLIQFTEINKRIPRVFGGDEVEQELGRLCSKLRYKKKRNILSQDKINKLEKILGWYWTEETKITKFQTFEEKYIDIKQWVINNKRIPGEYSKDIEEKRLGRICNKLRANKRKNKLTIEQINLLSEITGWFWERDVIKKSFDEYFEEFVKFITKNNRTPIKYGVDDPNEIKLTEWCQRIKKKHKNGKLDIESFNKLNNIKEWKWETYKI